MFDRPKKGRFIPKMRRALPELRHIKILIKYYITPFPENQIFFDFFFLFFGIFLFLPKTGAQGAFFCEKLL